MVFLLLLVVILAIPLAMLKMSSDDGRKQVENRAEIELARLNSIEGFNPPLHHGGVHAYGIALDQQSEQFAITIPGYPPRLYHYTQLVAAEIVRDGVAVTTTKGKVDMAGAAVATALVGPLGAAIGGKVSSTSTTRNTITKLSLKVFTNDPYSPCFEVPFFSSPTATAPTDRFVQSAAQSMDEWFGRLQTILLGLQRQGADGSSTAAITHSAVAPMPNPVQVPWAARVFG